jgi:hypothetical protein
MGHGTFLGGHTLLVARPPKRPQSLGSKRCKLISELRRNVRQMRRAGASGVEIDRHIRELERLEAYQRYLSAQRRSGVEKAQISLARSHALMGF